MSDDAHWPLEPLGPLALDSIRAEAISSGPVPARFIDLDGTIRQAKDDGFINGPEDVELLPETDRLIEDRNTCLMVAVTNRGGVARQYEQPDAELYSFERTQQLLVKRHTQGQTLEQMVEATGTRAWPFDLAYAVPFMDGPGSAKPYDRLSLLRKPAAGIAALAEAQALRDLGVLIDWTNTIIVGDRKSDRRFAKAIRDQLESVRTDGYGMPEFLSPEEYFGDS